MGRMAECLHLRGAAVVFARVQRHEGGAGGRPEACIAATGAALIEVKSSQSCCSARSRASAANRPITSTVVITGALNTTTSAQCASASIVTLDGSAGSWPRTSAASAGFAAKKPTSQRP